jgi:phospholipid transport system substrate-binding protein
MMMLALVALPLTGARAATGDDPKAVVEAAVNGVIKVLTSRPDPKKITEADREAIRQAVEGYFDFREMARRALGKPWKKLSEEQRKEFVATFRELLERSYGNRLSEYHNQKVIYGDVKTKGRIAIVHSEVVDADKRTPVLYKLVHRKNGWRVYDIKVEGISMVSTFRTDFRQSVSQKGLEGFLADLKKRVDELREQDTKAKS